jgi:hypothetical protein
MKIFAIACLTLACATTAGAQPSPAPRRPPPPKGCVARGTPMFAIDKKADPGAKLKTSSFKIYESGAWTFQPVDADGKAGVLERGCFAGDDLAKIKEDVKAPWKVTTAKFHCMMYSPSFTEYSVNGKLVYTARMCSGKSLDDASTKALADLEAKVAATGA